MRRALSQPEGSAPGSLHEVVGGDQWFVDLVNRFYDGVEQDPVLRPLYPEDLTDSRKWLAMFLQQYWGGSHAYDEQRGHPRLRMRHAGFVVGERERAAWMTHMTAAGESGGLEPEAQEIVMAYFGNTGRQLINDESAK